MLYQNSSQTPYLFSLLKILIVTLNSHTIYTFNPDASGVESSFSNEIVYQIFPLLGYLIDYNHRGVAKISSNRAVLLGAFRSDGQFLIQRSVSLICILSAESVYKTFADRKCKNEKGARKYDFDARKKAFKHHIRFSMGVVRSSPKLKFDAYRENQDAYHRRLFDEAAGATGMLDPGML